jgi:hypothetical protein
VNLIGNGLTQWPDDEFAAESSVVGLDGRWMLGLIGDAFAERLREILNNCQPYLNET